MQNLCIIFVPAEARCLRASRLNSCNFYYGQCNRIIRLAYGVTLLLVRLTFIPTRLPWQPNTISLQDSNFMAKLCCRQ